MRIFQNLSIYLLPIVLSAQSTFIPPLKEKIALSGNYAEIRTNHFHAGLDIKTHATDHLPIYCVGDGYVSRIRVWTHGYGKVLYVTHPNGLVSVYAHQYSFNDKIKAYTEQEQIKSETFEIELFPKPGDLPLKQGEVIGYSGNTGDSDGPHLHFEIRDEKTEAPLNPLRYIKVIDSVAPSLTGLYLYEGKYIHHLIKLPAKKNYRYSDTFRLKEAFGIGIDCYDQETIPGNRNNISKAEIFIDGKLYYRHILDSIHFDLARYVNTYCDYKMKREKQVTIQKCFLSKNNDLPIYKVLNGNGYISFPDEGFHLIEVKVYDFYGLSDGLSFWACSIKDQKNADNNSVFSTGNLQDCRQPYKTSTNEYRIQLPAKSLYEDAVLQPSYKEDRLYFYAKDYDIPLQRSCTLSIKTPAPLTKYSDKLCVEEIQVNGSKGYAGGEYADGWVKTSVKNFGSFRIGMDTIAPKIKSFLQNRSSNAYRVGDVLLFKVTDEFSGIGKFKLFVNGVFQLSEYDHRPGLISFIVQERTPKGKSVLKLEVWDRKGNKAEIETTIWIK